MSAEYSVIYYSLKFPVRPEETEALKQGTHWYQRVAEQFGLDCDWKDCWLEGEDYAVFIGKELGKVGAEYKWNQEISGTEMGQIMEKTQALLLAAGFSEEPMLHLHFVPNI